MNEAEEREDELRWVTLDSLIRQMNKYRLARDEAGFSMCARLVYETWQDILEHGDD